MRRWRRGEHIIGAGGSQKSCHAGFTYLELVVVMAILALLFFFSLPRLDSYLFSDPSKKVARLIVSTVQNLKQRALTDQKEYRLCIATETGELWVADATMDKKGLAEARKNGFSLPDTMNIEAPDFSSDSEGLSGEVMVRFYPKGYSDGGELLLVEDGHKLRLVIEPFLSRVEVVEDYGNGF